MAKDWDTQASGAPTAQNQKMEASRKPHGTGPGHASQHGTTQIWNKDKQPAGHHTAQDQGQGGEQLNTWCRTRM